MPTAVANPRIKTGGSEAGTGYTQIKDPDPKELAERQRVYALYESAFSSTVFMNQDSILLAKSLKRRNIQYGTRYLYMYFRIGLGACLYGYPTRPATPVFGPSQWFSPS